MALISRFSPNWSDPEDLEAITVAREDLIAAAVDGVRQSALTANKHHFLFIGPRGSGKTHLVTLVHHRVRQMKDLAPQLRIAWLNEDETSDSLLSLLLREHRALSQEYPEEFPPESTEPIYDLTDKVEATDAITTLLLDQLREKTLLVLVENLDALFRDFAEGEAKRWRALMQNHPQFCIVSTAQRLFHGVSDQDAPFFGFFQVEQLRPFSVGDAADLLAKLATRKEDVSLASFIASPHGRARIRALHHLTGGNQRLFIILSEFIDRESLDSLIDPLEGLVDEQLTPYYQERIRWLPPLQRRIVEFLCTVSKPEPVKAIARRLFATSQSISGQLKDLRRIGYLQSKKRGRESLYELAEPLMRLSHQVKEAQGRTALRLLVDFLRVWYDREELEGRLKSLSSKTPLTQQYLEQALSLSERDGNLRLQYLTEETEAMDLTCCDEEQLEALLDLKEESNDPKDELRYGVALTHSGKFAEARDTLTALLDHGEIDSRTSTTALLSRGVAHGRLGDSHAAIADYTAVIHCDDALPDEIASALIYRGYNILKLGKPHTAIADYSAVIESNEYPPDQIAMALVNRGVARDHLSDFRAAIADFTAVVEDDNSPPDQIAMALNNRAVAHGRLGDFRAEIADYTAILEGDGFMPDQTAGALVCRGLTFSQLGDSQAAIADYSAVIQMNPEPEVSSRAHFGMANTLVDCQRWNKTLEHLREGFSRIESPSLSYLGDRAKYITAILSSGQSTETWKPRVDSLLDIYAEHGALNELGTGLVDSSAALSETHLSEERLLAWHTLWAERAQPHPELELPARLLRTAIAYFAADKDESALLDLPSEERRILVQALGLEKEDAP